MERHFERREPQRATFETEFAKVDEAERELAETVQEIKDILSTAASREEAAERLQDGEYLSKLDVAEAKRDEAYDELEAYLKNMGERLGGMARLAELVDRAEDDKPEETVGA